MRSSHHFSASGRAILPVVLFAIALSVAAVTSTSVSARPYPAEAAESWDVDLVAFESLVRKGRTGFETPEPMWAIFDPYASVDWAADRRHRGNLHTHTTHSDGVLNPHTVVDLYHHLGYDILAITDHDLVTYPWTGFSGLEPSVLSRRRLAGIPQRMPENLRFENRDPDTLGMIAIEGNEHSRHHHLGSFFNSHLGSSSVAESLDEIGARGGIAMLFHPGRYTPPISWYVDLYLRYDHLFGLEVYNQGDRYPGDRAIWDAILSETMPERPVWGYSNDDAHLPEHIGLNWNTFLLPELSAETVRHAMMNGLSYFSYAPDGPAGAQPPSIDSIDVDRVTGTITIHGRDYESIAWISGGEKVSIGNTVHLGDLDEAETYVRAKLYGAGGSLSGTQPFGFAPSANQ